jgi:tetratricopeptide (TPR) repeat protein
MKQVSNDKGDNIGRNKITKLFYDIAGDYINNINDIRISSDKLQTEDEEEFLKDVHIDRVKEYKNLLNRAEINIDLGYYEKAQEFIEDANTICHNHHKTLSYNALCIYATSNVAELTLTNHITVKIIKLLSKAKEHTEKSEIREIIAKSIADNFYLFIHRNLEQLHLHKPTNWITATVERFKLYYKAISKHLDQLETCFEIYPNIEYLKDCVKNLCGYEGYAWLSLNDDGSLVDLGVEFFNESTISKLYRLEKKIKEIEPNFILPEILYGNYFETPQKKKERLSVKKRKKAFSLIFIVLSISLFSIIIITAYDVKDFLSFLILFLIIVGLIQPWGTYRLNVIQRLIRLAEKKFISK